MKTKQQLTLNSVVERDHDVFDAVAGRDIVMVRVASGSYYGVSDVAREIWELIKQPIKISEVIAALAASYNVDQATCEREVLSFLESLLGERLLRIRDEPSE